MIIPAEILKELRLSQFVAVDIETTGLEYQKDRIIEFGAVQYTDGGPEKTFSMLINPQIPIPRHITRITGLQDKDVEKSPTMAEIADEVLQFIGDHPIIAHNISFDLPFLEYNFRKVKSTGAGEEKIRDYLFLPNDKHDTLLFARTFLPFLPGYSLGRLAEYFHIEQEGAHRALPDAATAGQLFLNLVDIAVKTDMRDVRRLLEILEPTDESIKTFLLHLQSLLATGKYHFESKLDRETFTYSANYYNIIGEEDTPESGTLEVQDIDESETGAFFGQDGTLQNTFGGFELRNEQVTMAQAVARAFNQQEFLVAEAGTGTGKSLAYLFPAIKWSINNYGPFGRVVISTNTKNLQEQLFFKDIPILHSILKEKFKAVLLKGKSNYLCLDKWFTVLSDMKYRLSTYERSKILPLYLWVKNTETGDISENTGFSVERNMGLWSKFIAENNYCPGKSCKYYSQCFLWRARNNARDAHLVLVNHSLLFSDLAAEQAVLSEYSNVIFDEAHNIEKIATDYLGIEISLWNFRDSFQKLFQKERIETGILVQMRKRVQLSDMESAKKDLLMTHLDSLISLVQACWNATQGFFKELTHQLRALLPGERESSYASRFRYRKEDGLADKMGPFTDELSGYLRKLLSALNDLLELLRELPDDSFRYKKQVFQELQAQFTQVDGLSNNLSYLIAAEWDNWVYWFELPSREKADYGRLYGAPLNISDILHEKLYKNLRTAIFTSATLTVGRSFEYLVSRIGLNLVERERLQTLLLDSPFNYEEQVLLAVPVYIPDPRSAEFNNAIKHFLEGLVREQRRGSLVLFTSYSMLNGMYEALRLTLESEKVPLLAQGINGSRHSIINQFKAIPHSMLFGTDSFWEGIDVPGKSLEILLITKLPFDVPSEPVIQAKAELIQKQGGNPFMEYSIPEAVIKLRQGFGRLIRSRSDYGAVIILDNRVVKKMYGRIFLQSLPAKSQVFHTEDELWEKLLQWFH